MSLSRTVSKINVDFSRKSPIFPIPVYLTLPLKGFPLELGTGAGGQRTKVFMMGLPGRTGSLTISSAVWIQSTHVTDGQTDRHWTTANTALTYSVARAAATICLRPCKLTISSYLFTRWHLFRLVGYLRHQQQVDL